MTHRPNDAPEMLYEPIKHGSLSLDQCFLCGTNLTSTSRSDEHVFPKWLLSKFNLWDMELTLLNGTTIAYRHLTVPCCATCNVNRLSRVEQIIKTGVDHGYDEFASLPDVIVYQWLLKVFYTISFRQLFLLLDRRDPLEGTILTDDVFNQFNVCHLLLQSVRFDVSFPTIPPWSVFLFRCHTYDEDPRLNFDYRDLFQGFAVSLRMGEIGVVACLQDNNAQEQLHGEHFAKFQSFPLHPLQFNELTARVFYTQHLLNRTPNIITISDKSNSMQVIPLPLQGLSSKPVYDEWCVRDYARVLSQLTGLRFEELFREPDNVITWLHNEDGSPKVLPSRITDGVGEAT